MRKDISALQGTELFKNLSQKHIEKVLDICHAVSFAKDEVVMKEGEIGDGMYIILEGAVEVIKKLVLDEMDDNEIAERNKIFTRLDAKQHAVFGEIALLDEMRRTATIRAVTNCSLYEIKKDDFLDLAEEDFELGYRILLNMARIVSARLRKADEDTIKLTTVLSIILKES